MTHVPFQTAQPTGAGLDSDAQIRIAHALEYIAVQLGEINERLSKRAEAAEKSIHDYSDAELAEIVRGGGKSA
jgi:hypothetical protein